MTDRVRVGIVGSGWWVDTMYLPALTRHRQAEVRAIVGSRPDHAARTAATWGIPATYLSLEAMLDAETLDALVVATPNRFHYPMAKAAIERGLHVLCEKPLGMNAREARELADAAEAAGVTTLVPYTYSFMPAMRYLKELVDGGYIGRPYHLNMRYYAGYGRAGEYMWRYDPEVAGAGTAGDLGSHWAYVARWLFGDVSTITAEFGFAVPRAPRPDGSEYARAEDSAVIALRFENGATGSIHVSSIAYEPSSFGQWHGIDLHGADGTLRHVNDWSANQQVVGARDGESAIHDLRVPDHCWGGAPREDVHKTYKHVFREQETQARAFVSAIAAGRRVKPDLADGLAVQRIIDAAVRSSVEGRRVSIAEITETETDRPAHPALGERGSLP